MDWRHIPSLPALRAFEAAARLGSYSAAARALNVTHAAIAQHVRGLEDHFGRPLMERQGQKMSPTPDGRHLARALSDGFGTIARASEDLMRLEENRPLRIASTASFAENWLMPRIGGFWAAHPGIGLEIVPAPQLVDLRRDGFDLALRYGHGHWEGVAAEPLVSAEHCIVAAPALFADGLPTSMADLRDARWILVGMRQEDSLWLTDNGLRHEDLKITYFDTGALVLQTVRAGHGISVQPWPIVARDIEMGFLIALFQEDQSELAYHIVTRPDHVSVRARTFIRWLKAQAQDAA